MRRTGQLDQDIWTRSHEQSTTNRKAKSRSKVLILNPNSLIVLMIRKLKLLITRNSIEARLLRQACTILETNNPLSPELKDWWKRHKE